MSHTNMPTGSIVQGCFNETAATTGSTAAANVLLGDVSTTSPWGAARSKTAPQNSVILELHTTANGPVLWLYKPNHNPALFDELSQQLASLEDPPRWVLPALGDETVETFVRFIKPLTDAFFRKTSENGIADDDPVLVDAAEELARGILLWRYGMPENVAQADTARAKGLWGELTVLTQLEDPAGGGLENASSCWKAFGAKWDIEKSGVVEPLEVKTTQRNTHTHELRHNQLIEGAACRLHLVSVRCSQATAETPTLEDLLLARRARAELLGEEGAVCVARVNLELERLTAAEKGLRLRQEGTTVVVPVINLPAFPAFPAEYRDLKYTVDLAADHSTTTGLSYGLASAPIDGLGLSARPLNCLRRIGVYTVGDLAELRDTDLLVLPNFGMTSLTEVRNKLAEWTTANGVGSQANGPLNALSYLSGSHFVKPPATAGVAHIPTAPIHSMLGHAPEEMLHEAGAQNAERHILTMNWALEHNNQNFSWREIQEAAKLLMGEDGHIASLAKGIYKAAGTPWVRSVRHTPSSGHYDESLFEGKHWYAFERTKGKPTQTERLGHKYQVELVWIVEFDVVGRRCLLAPTALPSLPATENALELPATDAYTNRALWLNYAYQIPLVYLRGF